MSTLHEQALTQAAAEVTAAEHALAKARDTRADAIRAALAAGTPYRDVQRLTGLSRGMVDAIRRGKTRLP